MFEVPIPNRGLAKLTHWYRYLDDCPAPIRESDFWTFKNCRLPRLPRRKITKRQQPEWRWQPSPEWHEALLRGQRLARQDRQEWQDRQKRIDSLKQPVPVIIAHEQISFRVTPPEDVPWLDPEKARRNGW